MEETLGRRIAAKRKALGLTQDALAEQLGITAQAVSKWENEQSCPDITMLPRLAEIFGCTTDELLGIAPKQFDTIEETAPQPPNQEAKSESIRWKALASPGAACGCWLFLTGLVALIDAIRLPPYDLADIGLLHIAISCGIFVFGIFSLFRRFSPLRLGCALAGGAFIFNLVTEPGIADMDWYVPLLAGIALFGLDMLIDTLLGRKRSVPLGHRVPSCIKNSFECEGESFDCSTSFGEDHHFISLPALSSGKASLSFGNLTLDLRGCETLADSCTLEITSAFGEMELIVPSRFRAESNLHTAFADFTTTGRPDPEPCATFYVNGTVSFGHMTMRYV